MKIIRYGIQNKKIKKLLGFSATENDSEDCVGVAFSLSVSKYEHGSVWLVDTFEKADYALKNNTKWYNAGYDTPMTYKNIDDFEVVKVILEVKDNM